MLPIAISILFGVTAILALAVAADSGRRGLCAAIGIWAELRRMDALRRMERGVSRAGASRQTARFYPPAPPAAA